MKHRSLTRSTLLKFAPFEVLFVFVLPLAYATAVGVGVGAAFAVFLPLSLLRWVVEAFYVASLLRPAARWFAARPRARSEAMTAEAAQAISAMPGRIAGPHGVCYWLVFSLAGLLIHALFPGEGMSVRTVWIGTVLALTPGIGAPVFAYPLFQLLLGDAAMTVANEASARGIDVELPTHSLRTRIAFLAMLLAAAPLPWAAAMGYRVGVDGSRDTAVSDARGAALDLAASLREGQATREALARYAGPDEAVVVLSSEGNVSAGAAELAAVARGSSVRGASGVASGALAGEDLVWARASIDADRTVVVVARVSTARGQAFLVMMSAFMVIVALWAPLSAAFFANSIASAMKRLTDASARIVEVGDLSAMGALPMVNDDEIGVTTRNFNELLARLRAITSGAKRVADGDLAISIDGVGDLPDAFRGMVDKLRLIVAQLRTTSVELAAAATEIYSAAQEQEAASTEQSGGMVEVTHTMESLAQASGHVAESVSGVLRDAERTKENTEVMAERITELNRHSQRISELLDVIREVAEKADLLALNGSLEATRAGESGRGFSLVAGEMRRLAERVKATVEDVRSLVADVRASGAATVMATDQSRKLVESTTEAARRITHVSQQQRSATEAVSASVRDIANVLSQAAGATTQTRIAAEALKVQAGELEDLVRRFKLEQES